MDVTGSLWKIKESLQNGNLCILPTDTILGLFSSTSNLPVERVFSVKKRSFDKPLAIFLPDIYEIEKYGIEGEESRTFAKNNLPGAYTILLKATDFAKQNLSPLLISSDGKIGIRIPNNSDILQLTREVIVCGTSVNVSGEDFAKEENIPQEIANCVDFLFKNEKTPQKMANIPSTIIDFSGESAVTIR